ncbi:unnamed protein product [Rotaria sordida]|uniref:SPOR domain-containing protein n=1 Tax=Rotaria sordida TaxID=392033 RepID=A0A815XIB6_9BILA|nr:unnamed protein product [Rotaria sordida]CAF1317105.1 unnamed protein product [Rotaria sordida]CAF1558212.1 unnamed protein product [Rotaria sordida]CAF4151269.1 unnamed protein product [Rotaria sordida]
MSIILFLILSIVQYSIGISIAAINDAITLEQYQQVKLGWTRDQVTQFVGGPGGLVISVPESPSDRNNIIVQYKGLIPSNVLQRQSTVVFSFSNGILWKKKQNLLDLTSNYIITKENYNQIETGWTYQQVTSTIGSKGNVIEESNIWPNITLMTVAYQGEDQEGLGYIQLGFMDGKLGSKPTYGWVSINPNTPRSTLTPTTNDFLPTDRITVEQYQQVQFGWTRNQLTQYVGSPGKVIPSPNSNTILVQYQGPSPDITAIAGFAFLNEILFTKSQLHFDFTANYKITKEQYNVIQIGWTYQQVKAALENQKGNVVTESSTNGYTSMVVQYTGIKDQQQMEDAIVTLGFSSEKLITKSQYGW